MIGTLVDGEKEWRPESRLASYDDVRQKAARIHRSGGISFVRHDQDIIVAHARGDHGSYDVELHRQYPGSASLTTWSCTCPWYTYAWLRSPQFKKLEGRMCSHALATLYEAQSREYTRGWEGFESEAGVHMEVNSAAPRSDRAGHPIVDGDHVIYAGDLYRSHANGLEPVASTHYGGHELRPLRWDEVEPEDLWCLNDEDPHFGYAPNSPLTMLPEKQRTRTEQHLQKHGLDYESGVKNLVDMYNRSGSQTRKEGHDWYEHDAGDAVKEMMGHGLSHEQSAGVIASLSPQSPWKTGTGSGNRRDAITYAKHWGEATRNGGKLTVSPEDVSAADAFQQRNPQKQPHNLHAGEYNVHAKEGEPGHISNFQLAHLPRFKTNPGIAQRDDAFRVLRGEKSQDVLKSEKTRSFFHNIHNPKTSHEFTVDTHEIRAVTGKQMKGKELGQFMTADAKGIGNLTYEAMKDMGQEATRRINTEHKSNLLPHQVQAVTWLQQRIEHPTARIKRPKAAAAKTAATAQRMPIDDLRKHLVHGYHTKNECEWLYKNEPNGPAEGNSHYTHEAWDKQVESIRKGGVRKPLHVSQDANGDMMVRDGNHRLAWAIDAGVKDVPVKIDKIERDSVSFPLKDRFDDPDVDPSGRWGPEHLAKTDIDHCEVCGSDDLWGTHSDEGEWQVVCQHCGHIQGKPKSRKSAVEEGGTSPLDYQGAHPKRLHIKDPSFKGDPKHPYFKEPGTVAFLDYSEEPNDGAYIHYMATHESQQRKGHANALVDELYRKHSGTVDFGKIMEPGAWQIYQRKLQEEPHRTRGKNRGSFSTRTSGFLDDPHTELHPALFDDDYFKRDAYQRIRDHLMEHLVEFRSPERWVHLVAFGSGISYNWDEGGDLDVQVFADPQGFAEFNPDQILPDADLLLKLRKDCLDANMATLLDLDIDSEMALQYYAHVGKGTDAEVKADQPYAAYDLDQGRWIVPPRPFTPEFYAMHFKALEAKAREIAAQAGALLEALQLDAADTQYWQAMVERSPAGAYEEELDRSRAEAERTHEAIKTLYAQLYRERMKAYAPEGQGISDERDELHKLLEELGIIQRLRDQARTPLPWEPIS